jgi:(1->4)-alpha-D-glucan 1-alpha-D-glucosylmutase
VDFERRAAALAEVAARFDDPSARPALLAELVARPEDGRIKLHVLRRLLHDRRAAPELYAAGSYEALAAEGPLADRVFAFARCAGERMAIAVVPKLVGARLGPPDYAPLPAEAWRGTRLVVSPAIASGAWEDVVSGRRIDGSRGAGLDLADLFAALPVALIRNA